LSPHHAFECIEQDARHRSPASGSFPPNKETHLCMILHSCPVVLLLACFPLSVNIFDYVVRPVLHLVEYLAEIDADYPQCGGQNAKTEGDDGHYGSKAHQRIIKQ